LNALKSNTGPQIAYNSYTFCRFLIRLSAQFVVLSNTSCTQPSPIGFEDDSFIRVIVQRILEING